MSNKYLTLEEMQAELIRMLEKFADFCESHGLCYYLVGGTLLGAVRHQGFIPWDDDIDVGMPRADYNRFIELTDKERIGRDLIVVSAERGTLWHPFAEIWHEKIMLEKEIDTYFLEGCQVNHLFLDIIPQDGWDQDREERIRVQKKMKKLRKLCKWSRSKLGVGRTFPRMIAKTPIVLWTRMMGIQHYLRRMTALATANSYDESEMVGAVTFGLYGEGEYCVRREVVDFTEVIFAGRSYPAPGCVDSYLRGLYGDYMVLPPEEKRKTHKMLAYRVDR